jgi:cell division protein FtsB
MMNEWKQTPRSKKTRLYFLIGLGILILIFFSISFFGEHGLIDTLRIYREVRILEARIEKIKSENTKLEEEINRLKNDKDYIEELARKNLGMVGENEIIYIFNDKKK